MAGGLAALLDVVPVDAAPKVVVGKDVMLAIFHVSTAGGAEVPLSVGGLRSSWTESDTWASLATRLDSDPAYAGTVTGCQIGSSRIEVVDDVEANMGLEVPITDIAAEWARGSQNFGICVRGVEGRDDDVSVVLGGDTRASVTIIYSAR